MKLKLDADGHVVVDNGKPVYVHEDGKEVAVDVAGTVATISRLNGESKSHREAKEAAEKSLKAFEGITDPSAALKALDTFKNLDAGKLQSAEAVQQRIDDVIKTVRAEYEPVVAERDTLKSQLDSEIVGGNFARSKFIGEKVAVPAHMVQKTYGSHFKVEGGKLKAYDGNGKEILSRVRHGEPADFDEAIEHIIASDPYKESILKGTGSTGSGARPGSGAGNGAKTMPRSQFEALDPASRAAKMKDGFTLTEA